MTEPKETRAAPTGIGSGPMTGVKTISTREFALFQALIQREAGIYLSQAKRDLLVNRLAPRLRELGCQKFEDYYRVADEDDAERVRMLDRICTNETQFFREPRHFEFLEQRIYPEWHARADAGKRPRRVRIWSSACSTGEEPYSVAMSLLSSFSPQTWDLHVLATDLSTRALEKATRGVWAVDRSNQIPEPHLKSFMLRGTRSQEGKMKASTDLRAIIEFRRFNLTAESYPYRESFDVIFCRNVLIYFDVAVRRHVLDHLADCLTKEGILFLGHAETACGLTSRLRAIMPTVYQRSDAGAVA
jgi:chemotaxis protein methyltransferase CheR